MRETKEQFTLNRAGVEEISERVERFLARQGMEAREIERMRLTVETLLRRVSEELGWATPCELTLGSRMGRARIRLCYPGKAFDPTLVGREGEGEAWSAQLLTDAGFVPSWSWRHGNNSLLLEPPAGKSCVWPGSLIAAALALAAGAFLPAKPLSALCRFVSKPLLDAAWGVFTALAPLTVFLSAVAVICGTGDTLSSGEPGRRMVRRFLERTGGWTLLGTAGAAALCLPALPRPDEDVSALLTGLFPRDLLSPFLRGELPPLLFLGVLFGAAVHTAGGRGARVRELAEQGSVVCERAAAYVFRLTPLLVFAAVTTLAARGMAAVLALWRPIAAFALCALVILAVKLTAVCVRCGRGVGETVKSLWPAFRAAFCTASSSSALGRTMDSCENELDVPHDLVLGGLSVGTVLCAPFAGLCFSAALVCLAANAGALPGIGELVLFAVLSAALAVALPKRRGALLLGFCLLTRQPDGLAAMVVLNVFLDPLATAFSNAYLQLELTAQSEMDE